MPAEQELPQLETLSEPASFRMTISEKRAVRLIASIDDEGLTESEVIRRFFDSAGLLATADKIRAKVA